MKMKAQLFNICGMQQKEWLEGNVQLQMCVLEKNENLK
jgi:hypothetical protein